MSLLTTSSVFGAEPRREREEPVDYPKAGTVLKQEKAVLLGKATINFSQLAAQEKLRAPQKDPSFESDARVRGGRGAPGPDHDVVARPS